MKRNRTPIKVLLLAAFLLAWGASLFSYAGISRVIQERYRASYANKALYLKVPIFAEKQFVNITGSSFHHDLAPSSTPYFKVGDQLRVLALDFSGEEIRFKLGAIAGLTVVELVFKFDAPLQESFPNSGVFDRALAATFTEGLKYTELDDAKRAYVEQEFDRATKEIAATSGTNRDTVLKYVAPLLPAFQDATHEVDNLQNRNQDLTKQLERSQAETRKLEGDSKSQQAEIVRLRNQAASLQEKIDSSTSQLTRLGDDLRSAKGVSQSYQRELGNLQRSLKIKVDPTRDLSLQISELGLAMQRIQKENDDLQGDNGALHAGLEREQADNARLTNENQDLKNSVRQKEDTIKTLTSKEDSLAHQYIVLKQVKDNLENVALSIGSLNTRVVEEKTEAGVQSGVISAYLGNILLGSVEWHFPERLSVNEDKAAEVSFSTESIDNVRLTSVERHIRESLGERLKLHVNLASSSDALELKPEKDSAIQEIGERDRATWRWRVTNRGGGDSRLRLAARLVNKNGDEIPLIQAEGRIVSSNLVRQFRNYLQPISLAIGAVLGALLICITGLFRRVSHSSPGKEHASADHHYTGRKQL